MSSQHNVGAYHWPGEAHTWCQFSPLGAFHGHGLIWQLQLFQIQETFQLDLLVVTKLFLLIEVFFRLRIPPCPTLNPFCLTLPLASSLPPSVSLGVCLGAMGKGEANDSQWLLISTICSALGPLISERKSNMWRESDRQKLSLTNRPIVCWRSAFKQEGPSNSFSVSPSRSLPRYKTRTYLCIGLCRSQLLLLICTAMESKYFITFSNKQLVWAHEVSSILWKERWRSHSITPEKNPPSFWSGLFCAESTLLKPLDLVAHLEMKSRVESPPFTLQHLFFDPKNILWALPPPLPLTQ